VGIPMLPVIKGAAHTTRGDRPLRPGHGLISGLECLGLATGGLTLRCCCLHSISGCLQIVTLLGPAPEDPMAAKGFVFRWSILYLFRILPVAADGPAYPSQRVQPARAGMLVAA